MMMPWGVGPWGVGPVGSFDGAVELPIPPPVATTLLTVPVIVIELDMERPN
jgi:hypothetical protein